MLNDAEVQMVAREVKARSGAVLTREMAGAIELKLMPLARREGFGSVNELIAAARIRADGALWARIADNMAQSESRFFRDRAKFELIRVGVLPEMMQRRGHERVRIWSAACATGQEPYSIAMLVEDMRAQGANPAVEILATDISERLLDKARTGLYTQFEVQRGLPIRRLIAHFEKTGDLWRISDRLRGGVRFEQHNLLQHPGHLGQFDVVLLCNVLPAFDLETRLAVLARIADVMKPDAVLLLGDGETLPEGCDALRIENGIVYKAGASRRAA